MRKFLVIAAIAVAVATVAAMCRADEYKRGPGGLLNWHQTNTYPSVPWPTVPVETAKANCIVSDTTPDVAPGKYPPPAESVRVAETNWWAVVVIGLGVLGVAICGGCWGAISEAKVTDGWK